MLLCFILDVTGCQQAEWDPLLSPLLFYLLSRKLSEVCFKCKKGDFLPHFLCVSEGIFSQHDNRFSSKRKSDKPREEIEILQTRVRANGMITTVLTNPLTQPSSTLQRSGMVMGFLAVRASEAVTLKRRQSSVMSR